MAMHVMRRQFADGLQHLYGAHHQGAAQAAANIGTSTSPKLRAMLRAGSKANLEQARRLEQVFRAAGLQPRRQHDKAMQGIIDANNARIARTRNPTARDLVNIELGQVAAHFYMATYGTLRGYAEALGNREATRLLQTTLDHTGLIDREFSRLARRLTSQSGTRGTANESALHTTAAMHPAISVAAVIGLIAAGIALLGQGEGASRTATSPRRPAPADDSLAETGHLGG